MKIKIIKSTTPTFWYGDKIGQIFEVDSKFADGNHYRAIDEFDRTIGFVYKGDCEVVSENKVKDVCDIIGIDWDIDKSKPFRLSDNYLYVVGDTGIVYIKYDDVGMKPSRVSLTDLINGKFTIIPTTEWAVPIKCEDGHRYKYICNIKGGIATKEFNGSIDDYSNMKLENMFDVDDFIPQEQINSIINGLKPNNHE